MALHRKLSASDIHSSYRFIVADDAERLAISLNPDGSPITDEDGLYTKLYQKDTNVEYLCTSTNPLTFSLITSGDVEAHTHPISDVTGLQAALDDKLENETITSLSINANILTYTDEDGVATDIDLSLYLDDTNLARIVSGTLNATTGIVTVTRDDGTTFTVDMSALLGTDVVVEDNLVSTSVDNALSANQGRELKALIDSSEGGESSTEVTLVAKGDIPNIGQTVALNSDGTVSIIENTAAPVEVYGTTVALDNDGTHDYTLGVYDPLTGKILVQVDEYAYVGTILNDVITFGSSVLVRPSGYSIQHAVTTVIPDASANNIMFFFWAGDGLFYRNGYIDASGTLIIAGAIKIYDEGDHDNLYIGDVAFDFDNDTCVVGAIFADGNNYTAWVLPFNFTSPTSPTYPSSWTKVDAIKLDTSSMSISYNKEEETYIYAFVNSDATPYNTRLIAFTLSGTSFTFGATFEASNDSEKYNPVLTYHPVIKKTVLVYQKYNVTFVRVINISGLTLTGDTPVEVNSFYNSTHDISIMYDENLNALILASKSWDVGTTYSQVIYLEDTGTSISITYDTPVVLFDADTTDMQYSNVSYYPGTNKILITYYDHEDTEYPVYAGFLRPTAATETNAADFIGIAQEAVADTEDVAVIVHGGIDEKQTGLTINAKYWIDSDGSLSNTDTGYPLVGKALSAASIAITWDDEDTTYTIGDGGLTEKNFTAADKTNVDLIPGITETYHKNGFDLQNLNTIGIPTWSDSTRKLTISPISGQPDFHYWIDGIKHIQTQAIESAAIPNVTGVYYFYIDDNDVMQNVEASSVTADIVYEFAICGLVYWNATAGIGKPFKEQHGYRMDSSDHEMEHCTFGARYAPPGMELMGLVDGQDTWTGISSGKFYDEDIAHTITALPELPFLYRKGSGAGEWYWTAADNKISYMDGGSLTVWNKYDSAQDNWLLEPADSSHDFVLHFVVAHKMLDTFIDGSIIIDQAGYASKGKARDAIEGAKNKLILDGLPSPEICFLGCYIARKNGNLEDLSDGSTYYDLRGTSSRGNGGSSVNSTLAVDILVDTTNFNKNLSASDNVVQIALQTLNDMNLGGGGGGTLSPWLVKTSNYTAAADDRILADTSTAAFTITLPASPTIGMSVKIGQGVGLFSVNNLTIGGNGEPIMGLAEDFVIDVDDIAPEFVYSGSDWRIV